MLVICEDCAKKYNVDESRIKGEKARFSCYECGHIIVVKKPKSVTTSPEPSEPSEPSEEPEIDEESEIPETMLMTDEEDMAYMVSNDSPEVQQEKERSASKGKGRFTSNFFKMTIITAILVVGGITYYMYLQ